MKRTPYLAIEFILIDAMKVPWLTILPLRGMFSLEKIQKKRQKRTLEVKASLTPGLSALFASTGKISVFIPKWNLVFSQISWATVGINTLSAKQTNSQKTLFVQHLMWNYKLCKFSYRVPVPTFAISIVSKLHGRQQAVTWPVCAAGAGGRTGTSLRWGPWLCWPRWPERQVCRGHSLLRRWALPMAGPCCKSILGSLNVAVTVRTNSPSQKVPHKSPPAAGDLLRFPYTPLLPAQAASLFCLHKESFCLPGLPFPVQTQLSSLSASGANKGPGRGERWAKWNAAFWMLLPRGEVRLFDSAVLAFLLGGHHSLSFQL